MAGLRGNIAWLAAAKQSVKGTPAVPATGTAYRVPFSGGSIGPVRETDNLAETDASRDRGTAYVTTAGVEGAPEVYVRDDSIGWFLANSFGTTATSGTTNFTHTITPGNTVPYTTFWRDIADTLYERYTDCMISGITISAEAGSPLTATVNVQGVTAGRRIVSDTDIVALLGPAGAGTDIPVGNSAVYNYNDAAVTLGGGATALVRSFDFTLENNVTRQQTDDVTPYDVVAGTREVSLGFDLIFETLDEYNKFHYGGVSGTATSSAIYETSAAFTFTKGTNNAISFTFPRLAYEEFPVEPDPGGDPITVSVRAVGQRGTTPIVTAVVKNQVTSYAT